MKRFWEILFQIIISVLIILQVSASVKAYRSNKYAVMWQRCQDSDMSDTEAYAYINHFSHGETYFWIVVWGILALLVCKICWSVWNSSWREIKDITLKDVFAWIARWTMHGVGIVYLMIGGGLVCLVMSDLYRFVQNENPTWIYWHLIRLANQCTNGNVYLFLACRMCVSLVFAGIGVLEFYAAHKGAGKKYLYWPMLAVAAFTCGLVAFFFFAIYFA